MAIEFSKILVGIDGSEESINAADYAIDIANKCRANCYQCINFWYWICIFVSWCRKSAFDNKGSQLLAEDEAKIWLDKIKEKADKSGIRFRSETIMVKGSPASIMLDYAEEQNINLIVVGTRGRSGIKKMLLGSIASELVTHAASPVLVVKWGANISIEYIYLLSIVRAWEDWDWEW
jgi:nucleotide-binding universal stress UspA family protein